MKRLLLLAGGKLNGERYMKYAFHWIQDFFKALSPKTILYIPYALKDTDAEEAIKDFKQISDSLQIKVILPPIDTYDPMELLAGVNGVVMSGGNTFRLLYKLQETKLGEAIEKKVKENSMLYMGISAGINVAAPTIKTTNDMPIVMPYSLFGMGLVDFQLNPHYVDGRFYYPNEMGIVAYGGETRAERIAQFYEEEENIKPVVGLREGTALQIIGGDMELLGGKPAKVFRQGKPPTEAKDGKELAELLSK